MENIKNKKQVMKLQDLAIGTIYKNEIPTYQLPPVLRRDIDIEYAAEKGYAESVLYILKTMLNNRYEGYEGISSYSLVNGMKFLIDKNLIVPFKVAFKLILDNKIEIGSIKGTDYEMFSLAMFQFVLFEYACAFNKMDFAEYISENCKNPLENETKRLRSHEVNDSIDFLYSLRRVQRDVDWYNLVGFTISKLCVDEENGGYLLLYV